MWSVFYWENLQFAINLLAALTWLAAGWLYADAWIARYRFRAVPLLLGFLLLAISFALDAVTVETDVLGSSFLQGWIFSWLQFCLRPAGYILIVIGLLIQRVEKKPHTEPVFGTTAEKKTDPAAPDDHFPDLTSSPFSLSVLASPILGATSTAARPILALLVSLLYFRHLIVGLERHLRPLAWSFLLLAFYELGRVAVVFRETTHPVLYQAVRPYGVAWLITYSFLLVAVFIAARWVAKYLLKRLQTQLFMIFILAVILIFLATTVTYTALLLGNVRQAALDRLNTDRAVLEYALSTKKGALLSDAELLAADEHVQVAAANADQVALQGLLQIFLQQKQPTTLLVSDVNGRVIARGEDPERVGDSLSGNPIMQRALRGEAVVSLMTTENALAPQVSIVSAVPITHNNQKVGALWTGITMDSAFLTGFKSVTGLDVAVYGQEILAATTLTGGEDNSSLGIGTQLVPTDLAAQVLSENQIQLSSLSYLGTPYLASFSPLRGLDDENIGILFIGAPEYALVKTASSSLQLTFIISAVLMGAAIVPAYLVSRRLARQLH